MYINVQFAKFSQTDHICAARTHIKNDCPDCVRVSECVYVSLSCPTVCDPMDYGPPSFSICGISQARIIEWVAISSPKCNHTVCGSVYGFFCSALFGNLSVLLCIVCC